MLKCNIIQLGKFRNGNPKYWCKTHQSVAFKKDSILNHCENNLDVEIKSTEKLFLDPEDWQGGVGLWGALNSVYSTAEYTYEEFGIHVHARHKTDGEKNIDDTFKEVHIKTPKINLFDEDDYIKLNSEIATAYTCSMVFNKEMKYIECKHCSKPHIDSGYFSVTYHKKHICTYCGKEFRDEVLGISNPIVEVKNIFKDKCFNQSISLVDRELNINQSDYPGGIEIWGSNPAIIWTANRQEEAGIHVHVYKNNGTNDRLFDDTYGVVIIDGIKLYENQIRYLMVQKTLPFLNKKIKNIKCPKCGENHFDKNDSAVKIHKHHLCEYCGNEFSSKIKCVSNPAVESLEKLRNNYELLQKY